MDFVFSAAEEAFRAELRAFLDEELPDWWRGLWADDERVIGLTRQFCEKLAARGWLTWSWPSEFGGADGDLWSETILREEMWGHGEPRGPQYMNLNYIGPMIMRFGTAEQKARFLPPMAAGRVLWTQGFSEPGSGSDLASVTTAARADGDHFVVNGQKIWSSYANAPAEWCLLLVRTDPAAARHRGLSILMVDMTLPGVTVRPIDSMAGPREFCEIFFDDVEVPAVCILGGVNEGWNMIMAGLAFERGGIPWHAKAAALIEVLIRHARTTVVDGRPLAERSEVRRKIAELHCRCEAARLTSYRVVSLLANGEVPTTEAAVAMIHGSTLDQAAGRTALELMGPTGLIVHPDRDAPIGGDMERYWVESIPATIAGGTLEIQKNIVAQRGLGLPRPA
jgi:alkylation response protein AidB-like acyl-CoA dehydrogenase